ncbi:MAG: hypothetical protein ABJD70_10470 [Halioglobus sp.]
MIWISTAVMTYLLIAVIIAVALAPLLHFVPSKRQREQADFREAAAVAGLFVEFRDLPWSQRERAAPGHRPEQTIYYGKRLPASRGEARTQCAWRRVGDEWEGVELRNTPPVLLEELPLGVLAASVDEGSCGVYWREQGDLESVASIIAVLHRWQEKL